MLFLENLFDLFVDMSFYIVIGLIFTGLLHAFVKQDAILKHVGKDNTSSVAKAAILGVPLPLCSCGVVPTAMYLGKSGASKGAVVSFLTSTPQTGVDSIIATYGLMGPLFAIYRAIAAFLSGIIAGVVTNILCVHDIVHYCHHNHHEHDHHHEHEHEHVHSSCGCSHDHQVVDEPQSFTQKIIGSFKYAFGEFLDEIAVHFVVGLLIAALISTVLPESLLSSFDSPLISMILMVIIGIPMYICSTASIPIAVSLMLKGISPGAAFVFLFAGPVTNMASLTIIIKTLGKKVTAIYLTCVSVCAIVFGLILDYIIDFIGYDGITNLIHESHAHEMPLYMYIVAAVFGVLVVRSIVKQYSKK